MVQELERVQAARLLYDVRGSLHKKDHRRMALECCCSKSSMQWVAALPTGPELTMSNVQFVEIAARSLGLPSPAAVERLGQTIAGKRHVRQGEPQEQWVVDAYGDHISSVSLAKGFEDRHDVFKWELAHMMRWADMQCEVEVYGVFAGLIAQGPHAALVATYGKRKRQGLVPDFQIRGRGLAELKFIGATPSHYPARMDMKTKIRVPPVDKRAGEFQKLYEDKARSVDGPEGKVLARLKGFGPITGFVVGAYGEFSEDLLEFVKILAASKIKMQLKDAQAAASVVVSHIRRRLGVVALKANADFLMDGLRWSGVSGAEAYKTRKARRWEDQEGRKEIQAEYYCTFHRSHAHMGAGGACDWGPRPGEGGPGGG